MNSKLSNTLIGKNLNGRYRVISALGTGGFGTTYLAEDQHRPGHPRCVVKQLELNSDNAQLVNVTRRLFNTEAETLQKISDHEQIPELLASFEVEGQFFLVQEFIPGPSLVTEILSDQALPEPRVTKLLKDVLNVLEFVHAKGVVHRNLKADNLIHHQQLDKWVLINFGSEKALKEISSQLMGQKKSSAMAFTSPDQKANEMNISPSSASSDIYALGMICLQALTGMPPSEIERDPKTGEIRWPADIVSHVSSKLRNVISKMVFHDSKQRYSSATEILQVLEASPAFPLPKHSTKPSPSVPLAEVNPSVQKPLQSPPKASPSVQKPSQPLPSPEANPPVSKPITSSFNPSIKDDDPFTTLPNVSRTPSRPRERDPESRPEPSETNSVFAQPIVVDSANTPLPLWISGLGTLATLLAASFVFWIILKSDANNALVGSKPPAQESAQSQLNAEQRALLQEAGSPVKSQTESQASKQKKKSSLESKTPTPKAQEEVSDSFNVPVPPPPQLKIPTVQAPVNKPQPKTSVSEALAKSELNSATRKQEPTKANLPNPLAKSEESTDVKSETNTAKSSDSASPSTLPKPEGKDIPEIKQTEGDKGSGPVSASAPVAKNSPEPSKSETPSPLPSVASNSGTTSPQKTPSEEESRKTIATASPSSSRVDISLVNATGTVVSYQVLGNTDERSLYADMRSNLRRLPAPANVSFYRPDRGPIEVSTKTIGPNKIEVTLRRGNGPDDDHSFLTVQESGKVILN